MKFQSLKWLSMYSRNFEKVTFLWELCLKLGYVRNENQRYRPSCQKVAGSQAPQLHSLRGPWVWGWGELGGQREEAGDFLTELELGSWNRSTKFGLSGRCFEIDGPHTRPKQMFTTFAFKAHLEDRRGGSVVRVRLAIGRSRVRSPAEWYQRL